MLFSRQTSNICWICSSTESLSGEHKIKKTDLKRYNEARPSFKRLLDGIDQHIQGLDSKYLKFEKSICTKCNNEVTQPADEAYDEYRNTQENLAGASANGAFSVESQEAEHELGFACRIELARYFGKHLGCALDYQNFPIPRRLSKFVGCESDSNCILVSTRVAPRVWKDESEGVNHINALGGAMMQLGKGPFRLPFIYQSAYMTGGVQFVVKMRLSVLEALEISFLYLKRMGTLVDDFNDDEAAYRGLAYKK